MNVKDYNVNGYITDEKLGGIQGDMERKYHSVSISKKLIDEINILIESEKLTYTTKSDFIKDAIRLRLRAFYVKV